MYTSYQIEETIVLIVDYIYTNELVKFERGLHSILSICVLNLFSLQCILKSMVISIKLGW